ncbi:hypothetical protein THOA03_50124 [Vibrio owensii]|nr:hypothetical protein THOA03_50124 [Vibrio owensii]
MDAIYLSTSIATAVANECRSEHIMMLIMGGYNILLRKEAHPKMSLLSKNPLLT